MARRGSVAALLAGLALVAGSAPSWAQSAAFTASFFSARSSTAGTTFDSVYLFNSVDLSSGPLRVTFSVPFVRQHVVTEATVDPADGTMIPASDTTSTGFGDPLARVDVTLVDDAARSLVVSLAGSVKLPVVDAAGGLGTGETDVAFGGSVFKAAGRTSFLADALFWKYGDPEGVDFEDALSYSVGIGRVVGTTGRWSTLVALSGFTAGFNSLAAPVQLNVGLLGLIGRRQSLAVSAGIGLSESATDFSIGTSWRVAL